MQTCVLHLIRTTFRYASRADWDRLARDLRPVYTAATEQAAKDRFDELVGHFPNEQAALKCLYLTIRSLDPSGTGRACWITRWKAALNAFAITLDDRVNLDNN